MRLRLLAVALAAATPFGLAGIATAAPGDLDVSPSSGAAGSSFSVTGECSAVPAGADDPYALALLIDGDEIVSGVEVSLDGTTFSGDIAVPDGTAAGEYAVAAACFEGNSEDEDPFFEFEDGSFTVTGGGSGSDTPTVGVLPDETGGGAAPAVPVRATPTFTG